MAKSERRCWNYAIRTAYIDPELKSKSSPYQTFLDLIYYLDFMALTTQVLSLHSQTHT